MDATTARSGPFWDALEGRAPLPRAAATLGLEFIDANVENGTIQFAFTATEAFTNPTGNVSGAFLAAMLYDTVGPALLATLEPDQFQSTLDLSVTFLRLVRPGRIVANGKVVRRVGDIAYLEASLTIRAARPSPRRRPSLASFPGAGKDRSLSATLGGEHDQLKS